VAVRCTMRPMLPQMTASPAGDHTARSGEIQRPVLLLCLMTTRSARPLAPSQMRSVLSREVVSTRFDPARPSHDPELITDSTDTRIAEALRTLRLLQRGGVRCHPPYRVRDTRANEALFKQNGSNAKPQWINCIHLDKMCWKLLARIQMARCLEPGRQETKRITVSAPFGAKYAAWHVNECPAVAIGCTAAPPPVQ